MRNNYCFFLCLYVIFFTNIFSYNIQSQVHLINPDSNSVLIINPEKAHLLNVSSGITKFSNKDEAISPFIYRGIGVPVELSYHYYRNKSIQSTSISFENVGLKSSIPNYTSFNIIHQVQMINIKMEYCYGRKLYVLPELKTSFFLGAGLELFYNLRSHMFQTEGVQIIVDGFNSTVINIMIEKKFLNNKHLLRAQFSIPFLSWTLMPNTYHGNTGNFFDKFDPKENLAKQILKYGELVSFNKLFKIDFNLSYTWFIRKRLGFITQYNFRYYNFEKYNNLLYSSTLNNQVLIGLSFKLNK